MKNLVNGKIFITACKNLPEKLNSTRFQLDTGSYMNSELQGDYLKHGKENFSFEILDYL